MSLIEFNLNPIINNSIILDYRISGDINNQLNFLMPDEWNSDLDNLGVVLVLLCGSKYPIVKMDATIDPFDKLSLEKLFKIQILAPEKSKRVSNNNEINLGLSFSGGLDSLACHALLPTETKLVSMDFGGRFSREFDFFKNFNTSIISTNLCDLGFNKNSWMFMVSGILLMKSSLSLNMVSFGNILEASRNNIKKSFDIKSAKSNFLMSVGLIPQPVVLGLTEIGTAIVASRCFPDLIYDTLISLAGPSDEKFYRKNLLMKSLKDKYNLNYDLPMYSRPASLNLHFGVNFAVDFLTPYLIKNLGFDLSSSLNSGIPDKILKFASNSNLNFYERFDPRFLNNLSPSIRDHVFRKFSDFGMYPYESKDYDELYELDLILG